nr:hypothetical protein [Tanacetum cinerariifolium]
MTQLSSMCELACQIVQKKLEEKRIEEEQEANAQYWNILACCDDDDDYNSAITPVLSTEEPVDSLSMGGEHLDTIPATESDEIIKSSVEDLVPIPSESEGIPDTIDDDSLYNENIEYVEASPHNSELVSLDVAEIVISEEEEIENDNLREKLLNVHLLIANKQEEKRIEEEQAANARYWKIPACCDDDDDYNSSITPVLSTEEPDNSLSMGDEHLDTIPASPHDSEVVSLEVAEIVILEEEEIEDDNLREKLLNVHLLIANIQALKDNPTPSSKSLTKNLPDPGELISILNFGICENLSSTTRVNLPFVQYSQKLEDSCQRILSSKSSFPLLQLGI